MDKLIKELHKVFNYFNETKYNNELIEPTITIQKNPNKKKSILGWCSKMERWTRKENDKERTFYEINICADMLKRHYEEIIETLLHEICHLYHGQHKIDDVSSRGNHNENFKKEAERIGLLVEKAPRIGWSVTSLSESLLNEIHNMDIDKSAFEIYMIEDIKETKPRKPRQSKHKYKCPSCGKEIESKEEGLVIQCVNCECKFEEIIKNK